MQYCMNFILQRNITTVSPFSTWGSRRSLQGDREIVYKTFPKNSENFKIFAAIAFQLRRTKLPTRCRPTIANVKILCAA